MSFFALPALAQEPVDAVLYDTTLTPQPVTLVGLDTDAGRIVYRDAAGHRHEATFADVVRLSFPAEVAGPGDTPGSAAGASPQPRPVLATTDGMRIVGQAGQVPHAVLGSDDALVWRGADGFPAFGVSLDDLAWAVFRPESAGPPASQPTDDVLVLANGERLVGFVDTLGLKHVGFVLGDADDAIEIESSRVAGLVMSNALRDGAEPAVWVTMRSGSRWRCTVGAVSGEGGEEAFGITGPMQWEAPPGSPAAGMMKRPVRLGAADHAGQDGWPVVTRLDLPSPGRRLVALTSLPMAVESVGDVFGVEMPPRVTGGGALALHAPAEVAFELPEGAARLSATAALAIGKDVPIERHAWAGCAVVVTLGDTELARVTLDADHPHRPINLALPAGAGRESLRITVEEGVNGPVLDRVELRDAELLVNG